MIIQIDSLGFQDAWESLRSRPDIRQFVTNVARAHRGGQHIIYANILLLEKMAQIDGLGIDERTALHHARARQYDVPGLWDKVLVALRVTANIGGGTVRRREGTRTIFELPFTQLVDVDSVHCSVLLAEHATDANVYRRLALAWVASAGVGSLQISLDCHGCGGGNVNSVGQTFLGQNRWLLVITDSERKFPGGPAGSTAISAKTLAARASNEVIELIVLRSHELENLLPGWLIEESTRDLSPTDRERVLSARARGLLFEHDAQAEQVWYLDLKKGLTWQEVFSDEPGERRTYRERVARDVLRCTPDPTCNTDARCKTPSACCCEIVPALGKQVVDRVNDTTLRMSPHKIAERLAPIGSLAWSEISRAVFSWGCAWPRQIT